MRTVEKQTDLARKPKAMTPEPDERAKSNASAFEEDGPSVFHVPPAKAMEVLRAISNQNRYRILELIKKDPLSITEISRRLNIAQPSITNYVAQLEKTGIVATRIQRSLRGYQKMCSLLYDAICFTIEDVDEPTPPSLYYIELPVGHYSSINFRPPGLLATETGIIASMDDVSRFFYPLRMEAELLVMGSGEVVYYFPCNILESVELVSLTLTAELNPAFPLKSPNVDVCLRINQKGLPPLHLTAAPDHADGEVLASWYPAGLARSGQLATWHVGPEGAVINGVSYPEFEIGSLNLKNLHILEIAFQILPMGDEAGGIAFFGKEFGSQGQHIRLEVTYRTPTPAPPQSGGQ
jgi:predicted transcriptional regulator